MSDPCRDFLKQIVPVAYEAGEAIMAFYKVGHSVKIKPDGSPVTDADKASEDIILLALTRITPDIPIVSEEAAAAGSIPKTGKRFWLVDPLDGTKEMIKRNGEFTINIALIEEGRPVLGVVYAPALQKLFAGAEGCGAFMESDGKSRRIACRPVPAEGLTVVVSRTHGDDNVMCQFLTGRKIMTRRKIGSSLKLCLIASGEADLYPRLGETMEWDIAAGDAIIRAAGGNVTTLDGNPLEYGKPSYKNAPFVARGLE